MDTDDGWYWNEANNSFDRNRYIWRTPASRILDPGITGENWANRTSIGLEQNGELIVEQRRPMQLSCR